MNESVEWKWRCLKPGVKQIKKKNKEKKQQATKKPSNKRFSKSRKEQDTETRTNAMKKQAQHA